MNTSKGKKSKANQLPPATAEPEEAVVDTYGMESPVPVETKVSFTLEFYAAADDPIAFAGRLKKIGSDEKMTRVQGLDEAKIMNFLQQNLPKDWQTSLHGSRIELKSQGAKKNLLNPVREPAALAQGNIEIWQNGRTQKIVQSALPFRVKFGTELTLCWIEFSAHFKSLEPEVPSYQIAQQKTVEGTIFLELAAGQLQPGIYALKFRATAQERRNQKIHQYTADQLIQVI